MLQSKAAHCYSTRLLNIKELLTLQMQMEEYCLSWTKLMIRKRTNHTAGCEGIDKGDFTD